MAIIVGGASGAAQDVNATAKAANVILYDASGAALSPAPVYAGVVPVVVRQSAATAAGAIVWGLWNSSAKIVSIRSLFLQMFFDGTAAATLMKYELVKYTGVTSFSGGVVAVPLHKRSSLSGAQLSVARVLDTGLTATGGTAQSAVPLGAQGRVTQTTTGFSAGLLTPLQGATRGSLTTMAVELAQNELLALRQSVISVVGDNVVGLIEIEEN